MAASGHFDNCWTGVTTHTLLAHSVVRRQRHESGAELQQLHTERQALSSSVRALEKQLQGLEQQAAGHRKQLRQV